MRVACSCGEVFKSIKEQRIHSSIITPYHKLFHPDHYAVKPETKEEGDKRFEAVWKGIAREYVKEEAI